MSEVIPKNMRQTKLTKLFKNKGDKANIGSYHFIHSKMIPSYTALSHLGLGICGWHPTYQLLPLKSVRVSSSKSPVIMTRGDTIKVKRVRSQMKDDPVVSRLKIAILDERTKESIDQNF